jgi:hypothetical protein
MCICTCVINFLLHAPQMCLFGQPNSAISISYGNKYTKLLKALFDPRGPAFEVQQKPLNVITLGQTKSDNNNRMIKLIVFTLSGYYCKSNNETQRLD